MRVVLIKDIPGLGIAGQIKDVSDGYARNFLLPQELACSPNDPQVQAIVREKLNHRIAEKEQRTELETKAGKLSGQTFVFKAKADKKGHLYGSIGPKELSEKIGIKEDLITEHFKTLGEFPLKIKISPDNIAEIKIVIGKEK